MHTLFVSRFILKNKILPLPWQGGANGDENLKFGSKLTIPLQVWRDWAIERNSRASLSNKNGPYEIVPLDIKDASIEMMSFWLPRFITEVSAVNSMAVKI